MKQVMGIINLVHEADRLGKLTRNRCLASVPFGGKYRLIDFALSAMAHSGIRTVHVFTHTKYRELMAHLGTGRDWDFHRKRNGLSIVPPVGNEPKGPDFGDLFAFSEYRDMIQEASQEYVLITRGHGIGHVDYEKMLRQHMETEADVTALYIPRSGQTYAEGKQVHVDREGWLTIHSDDSHRTDEVGVLMESFLLHKSLLLDVIDASEKRKERENLRETLFHPAHSLKVSGMRCEGYVGMVNTIQSYYLHSMNLLLPEIWGDLFQRTRPIYTQARDEPPTRYTKEANVIASLVANGCTIEGEVENSILFRGVKVERGARIRNSIVLPGCVVRRHAQLNRVIMDERTEAMEGQRLFGDRLAPLVVIRSDPLWPESIVLPGYALPMS